MRILFLSSDVPSPFWAPTLRTFYSLKYLSQKYGHNITLLAFRNKSRGSSRWAEDLKQFCDATYFIDQPDVRSVFSFKLAGYLLKNMLSPRNYISMPPSILNFSYSPLMQRAVRELLQANQFDLLCCNTIAMYYLIHNMRLPKVLDINALDSVTYYQLSKFEKNVFKKVIWLLGYQRYQYWERRCLAFDTWVSICSSDAALLKSRFPDLNIKVIPYGVDMDYFKPMDIEPDFPSLVLVGTMNASHNIQAVQYFCSEIYPLIRERVPEVRFYIVGRNPTEEVMRLAADASITVTGYVDDVRPYLARATVVVVSHLVGAGTKTKVQEAMAMRKPIVSTSNGVRGIDVPLKDTIIVADEPQDFAARVVELISNEELRRQMGMNALSQARAEYSWEKATDELNKVFYLACQGR